MILNSHLITTREEIGEENFEKLTIPNPVYYNNEKLGFSNRGVSPVIELYEENEFGELILPRNAPVVYAEHNIIDERSKGHKINVKSKIQLRDEQKPAVKAVMEAGDGILQAGTGKGKSVMACEVIARFGRTTIILVHKEFLMDQFTDHLKNWLGLQDHEIGYCRGNPNTWTWKGRKVVIGMLQSIYAHIDNLPEGFVEYFGLVISDECLTYNTVVQTDKGELPIGKIVEEKIECNVLSFNRELQQFEYKPVTSWFNQGEKEVMRLEFDNGKVLECTSNHLILTKNRGYVQAGDLTEQDEIMEG